MRTDLNADRSGGFFASPARRNLLRFLIGPLAILLVFFLFERHRLGEVWKPLALYYGLAVPGFLLVDRVRARQQASRRPLAVNVGDAERKDRAEGTAS